ncbi:neuromedin-B receptor-like [Saccostrea echinata]|uniref:neuromedin-B receptor-like n=1 Tax=Saccostrea echinata TaxID=191078 RepID=UPI002A804B5B|nr:neuromedin-B receptor-like [Saccostrea echinata]
MMNSSGRAVDTQNIQYDPVDVGTKPSIVFLVFLMVIGTVANGHVFGIFLYRYKSRSTYVTFVLALALIDLLICVCDLPLEILDLSYPYNFFSEVGCKLYKVVSATLILSSVFTLTLLSRDRFKRIRHPLNPQWSNSTCRRYIGAVILLSFILSAPVIYIHGLHVVKISDGTEVEKCFFEDDIDEKLNLPLNFKGTRKVSGRLRSMNVVPKIQKKRKVLLGNHRSTVIMFIITSIFIFVFLPYLVLGVFLCLKENFKDNMNEVELSVYRLSMRLMFVNNIVNCFVYGIFDPRFKKVCKEFYKTCF